MGRAPCCDKNGLKKGPWTPEEDQKLIDYIQRHGHGSWRALPKQAGAVLILWLPRCGKSCRLRWTNYLRSDIKRGKISFEEEQTIIHLHSVLGNKWSTIAGHLPGRTDNEIKNYWNTHLKKRLLGMGIDPVTHRPRSDIFILGHLTQWENAVLEAEARWTREYLRVTNACGSIPVEDHKGVPIDTTTNLPSNNSFGRPDFDRKEIRGFNNQVILDQNQYLYSEEQFKSYQQDILLTDGICSNNSNDNMFSSTSSQGPMFSDDKSNNTCDTPTSTSFSWLQDQYNQALGSNLVNNNNGFEPVSGTATDVFIKPDLAPDSINSSTNCMIKPALAPDSINSSINYILNNNNNNIGSFPEQEFHPLNIAENIATTQQQDDIVEGLSCNCATDWSDIVSDDGREYWSNLLKLAEAIDPDHLDIMITGSHQ
eukprot:Gb_00379 [translate_table: standard]